MSAQALVPSYQVLLCLRNEALATYGSTATASSTAVTSSNPLTAMTADKLTRAGLDTAWRSGSIAAALAAGLTEISFTVLLALPRPMDWVSLHRTNNLLPWRYRFRRRPGETPLYESPWLSPVVRATLDEFGWRDLSWTLGPTNRQLAALASRFFIDNIGPADRTYPGVGVVEVVFDITSGANGAHDYVQVGLPYLCKSFRPEVNMSLDWGLQLQGRSEVKISESGAKVGRFKPPGKTFTFALNWLERSETWGRLNDDLEEAGELGIVFAWPEPAHRRYFYSQAMLGTLSSSLPAASMLTLENPGMKGWSIERAP